jgi:hypothetical protein
MDFVKLKNEDVSFFSYADVKAKNNNHLWMEMALHNAYFVNVGLIFLCIHEIYSK